ncbi:MAG TPA: efflux RND transporter permease subunit [Planctomycetota bacterium]|nr:efflux RND transporter permease subunit [Planctomycetota bacterium]
MSISEPFIRRPIGTSLLMIAIMLTGVIGYWQLPVSALPRFDAATISVSALLPGANPETMASAVAAPLERRFGQIAGVTEMTSISGVGSCSVTLQFSLDRNADLAARDVQAAITAARGDLPTNLPNPPTWRKTNPADAPILILALASDTLTPGKVYQAASTILAQRMSQVTGVAQVLIFGAQKSAVRVNVNATALANMGLGFEDIRNLLNNSDAHGPKGTFDGSQNAFTIGDNDQLYEASAYQPLVLRAKNGNIVRLDAVAKVTDGVVDVRQAAWFNEEPATLIAIFKQPSANVIATVNAIKELEPQLEAWMPPAVKTTILSDRTASIRASVNEVQFTLALTVALVILIVFLFLRRFWSTFAAAVTIPLSLAGTFGGMYLCGYSVDNLSLMALTVAVGFVVDDAIVMIENVMRRHEAGDKPFQAALAGAKQIGFTVVSISISLIAVFIPLLFMGGIVGRLFREFAVTLSMAVAVSAVVSLTGTPMICAYLARPGSHAQGEQARHGWLDRVSEGFFDSILAVYRWSLDIVLRHQYVMLGVMAATVLLTGYLYYRIPKGFFPQQDTGRISATSEARTDISFKEMVAKQQQLNAILVKNEDVRAFNSSTGASGFNSLVNTGRFFIDLKDPADRKHTTTQVIAALTREAEKIPGIAFYPQLIQDVRVGGRISKSQYQYTLSSVDVSELNAFYPKLLAKLESLPMLERVTTDKFQGGLEARVTIDRDAAARFGIAPSDIDSALYDAFGQRQVAVIYTDIDQYRVVLEGNDAILEDPASLDKIYVKSTSTGKQVPLRTFAKFERGPQALAVNHQGQFPSVTISFDLKPDVALGDASEAIERAAREIDLPLSIRASFQGTAQAFQESLSTLPWLVVTALIAIYLILGVLYESLVHPLTILSTIPSAGIGALLALLLFGMPLDVMGYIGIILLIGIVKKNAIMMIDFALEAERDHAKEPAAAIREACLLRFRPIIMTTMAALLGATPLAIGHGIGAELRQPMGLAIVGGLIFSQMLTLYTTPVVYITLDKMRLWVKGHKRHPKANVEVAHG